MRKAWRSLPGRTFPFFSSDSHGELNTAESDVRVKNKILIASDERGDLTEKSRGSKHRV